ncbi:MAG: hypothetical protein IT364_21115 [Candidatus Hydrogenedentes bacterium]|nr:hypothetical protein [Candidatus Hydrogenedentota bacterium]
MRIRAGCLPVVFAMFLVTPSFASDISSGPAVVVATSESASVAVSLNVPASFVSVPVRVSCDQKNTGQSYEETRAAIALIVQKAAESGLFRVEKGVTSLSERKSSFGISSGAWRQPAAEADLYLLVPLAEEGSDVFTAGALAARFIEGLTLPGKLKCELGQLRLAVENPEQYRPKLLELIAQDIHATRKALKSVQGRTVKVEGLESPVIVRQVDDTKVEVLLDYAVTISWDE